MGVFLGVLVLHLPRYRIPSQCSGAQAPACGKGLGGVHNPPVKSTGKNSAKRAEGWVLLPVGLVYPNGSVRRCGCVWRFCVPWVGLMHVPQGQAERRAGIRAHLPHCGPQKTAADITAYIPTASLPPSTSCTAAPKWVRARAAI